MTEEDCGECGERHDSPSTAMTKLKRYHWSMTAGYFASLALLAFSAFKLAGPFGALAIAAGFGVFFCYLNMAVSGHHLNLRENMTLVPPPTEGDDTSGQGQYI